MVPCRVVRAVSCHVSRKPGLIHALRLRLCAMHLLTLLSSGLGRSLKLKPNQQTAAFFIAIYDCMSLSSSLLWVILEPLVV